MNQPFSYLGALGILVGNHIPEIIFWFLVGVAAVWFLWTCWRTVKKQP